VDGSDLFLFLGGVTGSGSVLASFTVDFGQDACP
jgi:hypothetical protein